MYQIELTKRKNEGTSVFGYSHIVQYFSIRYLCVEGYTLCYICVRDEVRRYGDHDLDQRDRSLRHCISEGSFARSVAGSVLDETPSTF